MLVPHFIRNHFKYLNQRYVTLLEIGGSHAHRLRRLIEHLGLITLVITDLDAAEQTGNHPAAQPMRSKGLITGNSTLKTWLPKKKFIDDLLDTSEAEKIKEYDPCFSVRVAYQIPTSVNLDQVIGPVEALSNTFEDALVFENISIFKDLQGIGLIKKFKNAINEHKTPETLGKVMFESLSDGKKAEFALNLIYLEEPKELKIPTYIKDGLSWLQDQLQRKQQEVLAMSEHPLLTIEESE